MKKDFTFIAFTDASSYNVTSEYPEEPQHSCSAGVINLGRNIVYSFIHYNENTTISYGELYAIYCILSDFVPLIENTDHKLILFTDSDFAFKSINVWSKSWKKNAKNGIWYGSSGGQVAYQRLIEAIIDLKDRANVKIYRISGGHIDISKRDYEDSRAYGKVYKKCRERCIRDNHLYLTSEHTHYCIFYNNICDQMAKAGLELGMEGKRINERERKSFKKFIAKCSE